MAQLLLSDENLRCSICLETFKEPKVLPCCHTFCKGCLSKLPVMKKPESELSFRGEQPALSDQPQNQEPTTSKATVRIPCSNTVPQYPSHVKVAASYRNDSEILGEVTDECIVNYVTCPQCRAEHKITRPNDVDGFLTNFVSERQLREQYSSNNLTCNGCEDGSKPVVAGCYECSEFLCDFCFTAHKTLKKFAGHNAKELADLDKERILLCKPHSGYVCPQHPIEGVQLYCQSCDTVVCNKCIVSCVHSGHKLSEIDSQTRSKVHEELFSLLAKVDENLKLQVKNLEYVKKVEKATSDMAVDIQQKINNTFDAYVSALGKRRKELLDDAESRCSKKMKVVWSEKDSLERVVADMTTTQNFTKRTKDCEDDKEFLLFASQALPRLKKLKNWNWNDEKIDEVECYRLTFKESDLTVGLISGTGELDVAQSLYKIEFQGFTDVAELGKEHSFTIHVLRGKCCRPWMSIKTPEVTLKHVRSSISSCDVHVADICITRTDSESQRSASLDSMDDDKKWEMMNNWRITYTPYCGGQHRLTIKVEGTLTVAKEIIVQGVPSVGSEVMRGPDGDYSMEKVVHSKRCSNTVCVKTYYRNAGRVIRSNPFSNTVCVQTHTGPREFAWGKDGKYEIQLKRSVIV